MITEQPGRYSSKRESHWMLIFVNVVLLTGAAVLLWIGAA